MEIGAWLHSLGLDRYKASFLDHDIDAEVLPELTADDLIGLGVTSIGHRRKLLAAIAELRAVRGASQAATGEAAGRRAVPDAERRQLTVMFCDIVGSTALSEQLDPEDLREIIGAYHRAIAQTIAPFEGFVAKYMGDGALIYFGYPRAHEDDAERAIRAALAFAATDKVEAATERLEIRVGIATGLVVVGDLLGAGAAQEEAVIGETPNVAARLQALAPPKDARWRDTHTMACRRLVFDTGRTATDQASSAPIRAWRV